MSLRATQAPVEAQEEAAKQVIENHIIPLNRPLRRREPKGWEVRSFIFAVGISLIFLLSCWAHVEGQNQPAEYLEIQEGLRK
jgi:hypothetical protein